MEKTKENVVYLLNYLATSGCLQIEIASELKVSQSAVSQWSRGETVPKPMYWRKLLRIKERVDERLTQEGKQSFLDNNPSFSTPVTYQQDLFSAPVPTTNSKPISHSIHHQGAIAVLEKPAKTNIASTSTISPELEPVALRDRIRGLSEKEAKAMLEAILSTFFTRELPMTHNETKKSNDLRNLLIDILKQRGFSLDNFEEARMFLLSKIPIDIASPSYLEFKDFLLGNSNSLTYHRHLVPIAFGLTAITGESYTPEELQELLDS